MARKNLFRQAALDRLASPEQLDALHGVTPRRLALVLATVAALVAVVVLWWLVDATGSGAGLPRSSMTSPG